MAWEELTAAEKGYIGGFLDGEGCITYCTSPQGNVYARVCFYNTNKEIIDWIADVFDEITTKRGIDRRRTLMNKGGQN
jgi:hypothetical protein